MKFPRTYNVLIKRILKASIGEKGRKYLKGELIDIGCGTKQYKPLLASVISRHVGLDHPGTPHDRSGIDILGSVYNIPEKDASFDSLLCTEVLEHLENPVSALRECNRVLKYGGYAVFTCPFMWHLHEVPRDFYRYSSYGLKYLFDEAGFEIVEISPLGGFWLTFGQLLSYVLNTYNRGLLKYFPVLPLLGIVAQAIGYVLYKISPKEEWTSHYIAVVKKKAPPCPEEPVY